MHSVLSSIARFSGVAAIVLAAATSAHAATFNFSYQFGDSQVVAGTLDGTLNGASIDDVSNITLALDGVAFNGPISISAWDAATSSFDNAVPVQVSTIAANNNFVFADGDISTYDGLTNYFYMSSESALAGQQVFATSLTTGQSAVDAAPVASSWSLVPAAVPEAQSVAMFVAGAAFLGAVVRRRRQG